MGQVVCANMPAYYSRTIVGQVVCETEVTHIGLTQGLIDPKGEEGM